ncbi:hypothetical protein EVAR_91456_1 [Eumeta japonica]|uniref:Uncharacterized protein n=1 Tax=Eumeta variegata TaxID=151549 RepID=A0A4C1X384_EUMVA|nr:hypothetical protein EVAR_91456_1 [Eumeta japonica]
MWPLNKMDGARARPRLHHAITPAGTFFPFASPAAGGAARRVTGPVLFEVTPANASRRRRSIFVIILFSIRINEFVTFNQGCKALRTVQGKSPYFEVVSLARGIPIKRYMTAWDVKECRSASRSTTAPVRLRMGRPKLCKWMM